MPDIKLYRAHQLGLEKARDLARSWADQVHTKFGMQCTFHEGQGADTIEFMRSGVNGRLLVAADHFDLQAKLGFLLRAFSRTIEAEVAKELDALLGGSASPHSADKR